MYNHLYIFGKLGHSCVCNGVIFWSTNSVKYENFENLGIIVY